MNIEELQAKWDDTDALQQRLMDLFIARPQADAVERIMLTIETKEALAKKSAKELVDLALNNLSSNVESDAYQEIVEELCTRVHPNWPNEDPDGSAAIKGKEHG